MQHLRADLTQEGRVLVGLFAVSDEGDLLPPVEHPVAGGAVADAAAEELALAGIEVLARDAEGEDHAPRLVEIVPHGDAEAAAEVHDAQRAPADQLGAAALELLLQQLGERFAVELHARIVGDLLRLIEALRLHAAGDDRDALAAVAGGQRGRHRRDPPADDQDIKHVLHLPLPEYCLRFNRF